jgi:hypothetical protein
VLVEQVGMNQHVEGDADSAEDENESADHANEGDDEKDSSSIHVAVLA